MKKVSLFLAMALVSVLCMAQNSHYNQVVWLNGKMMYANPIPAIDSITFTDEATEQDTLFMLMPRAVVRMLHDTITVVKHDTVTVIQKDTVYIEPKGDKVIGRFAVSADKQVAFSQGNLQYTHSTKTWSFAEHQYEVIGDANVSNGTLADRIDLFGWSANDFTAPFGVSTSAEEVDYVGDFLDWGTNTIGNDAPNTWRTLTYDEWTYLFQHTCWTMAKVNGILGFMLLPNGFTAPSGMTVAVLGDGNMSKSKSYLYFDESDYASNQYTADEFAQFEMRGCVFLPCAGVRYGSNVYFVGSSTASGRYWSATQITSTLTMYLSFSSTGADLNKMNNTCYGYYGRSVRLVQDVE